jgi:hypothetical protein
MALEPNSEKILKNFDGIVDKPLNIDNLKALLLP